MTAYHEAGHAIVALAMGSIVRLVKIEPRPHVRCAHPSKRNKAITALAGGLAERRAFPTSDGGSAVDLEVAYAIARTLAPSAAPKMFASFIARAQAVLDRNWDTWK